MKLVRYNDPFAALDDMHRTMDEMWSGLFRAPTATAIGSLDIYEEDGKLNIEVAVPGFSKDQVEVDLHEGALEVKGKKESHEESKDKKRSYMVRESAETFYRRIALPKGVDTDKLEAHFDDGILKISMAHKELPTPKKINIKSKK